MPSTIAVTVSDVSRIAGIVVLTATLVSVALTANDPSLSSDKWTFFKESLELHAVVKANGLEVSDVVTLIQEYARQRDMQTA